MKIERKYLEKFLKEELIKSQIERDDSYQGVGELYIAREIPSENMRVGVDGSLLHIDERTPVQYALRKDFYEDKKQMMISPNNTIVMDGRDIRRRLDDLNR